MSFDLSVPRNDGTGLSIALGTGDLAFLLGANGTGKSSLMHRFYKDHKEKARRITAHRQTWFDPDGINMSPKMRSQTELITRSYDNDPKSRWSDQDATARSSMAIYDLVDVENVRARKITSAFDKNDIGLALKLGEQESPIRAINRLLKISNIPVEISVQENAQIAACKNDGARYSIGELSDGERNAILIAANVLTARQGTLLLIDEPERHLHRSIISPLLISLFTMRPDCTFIVSTHDVMLPLDNPGAKTLLIRGCTYRGTSAISWEVDLLSNDMAIDDQIKRDILGARRKIIFVEGNERSLDKSMYSIMFPDVSIITKGSCREVERAVTSIRDARQFTWLDAFGIVDNDRRSLVDIERLKAKGVYAIPVFSIESVYYHPEIQRRAAERHAAVTGHDAAECIVAAQIAALDAIAPHVQRFSERAAEVRIREELFANIPNREEISRGIPINLSIDTPRIVNEERAHLQSAIDARDLVTIISRYPARETPALDKIAQKLGFQNRGQYEATVRKLLVDDTGALDFARSLFGTLSSDIAAGAEATGPSLTDAPAPTGV